MLQITHSNDLIHRLASGIAGSDARWFIDVAELLENQSDVALSELLEMTDGYTAMCWEAVSNTLHAFIHGGGGTPDNTHLVDDGIPHEEFALKITFLLAPMAIAHYEDSLGTRVRSFDAEETYSLDDLYESATSDTYRVLSDLLPEERSLGIARACYLITLYGRRHEAPLPSGGDFTWMAENALDIMSIAESVFIDGVFDRGLAELMLKAEVPLREGVL